MDIMDAAARHLEHRMRTGAEMKKYLTGKGYEQDEIEEAVAELARGGYIDDVRYGCEYLRYAFEKGRSINRIKIEMGEKGISQDNIENAIFAYEDEYDTDIMEEEIARARQQAEKIAGAGGCDEKILAKMGRRLDSLGYNSSLIYKLIGEYRDM